MSTFHKCLRYIDDNGEVSVKELSDEVVCSLTVANFALQAYRYYKDNEYI